MCMCVCVFEAVTRRIATCKEKPTKCTQRGVKSLWKCYMDREWAIDIDMLFDLMFLAGFFSLVKNIILVLMLIIM